MSLYHFPKIIHKRVLSPRLFRRYQSYKKYLQYEFQRLCVYCREPDTTHRSSSYGVDHYRPKNDLRFSSLICDYNNLFYCCNACNSRKNDYWPTDEKQGPYIVNPCDHKMSEHLRFNKSTYEIDQLSDFGKFTSELLQLNEHSTVELRKTFSKMVDRYASLIAGFEKEVGMVKKLFKAGKLNRAQFDQEITDLQTDIDDATSELNTLIGNKPVVVRKNLKGLNLVQYT